MPGNCPYISSKEDAYKCVLPYYFVDKINVPMLILQSEYDEWQLNNILGLQCTGGESLKGCS